MKYEGKEWSERLNYLAALTPGWDDGHGKASSPEALDAADRLLTDLALSGRTSRPGVFPFVERTDTGDTGVGMEWDFERHQPYFVSIEITHDLHYEVFALNMLQDAAMDFSLETDSYEEALEAMRGLLASVKRVYKNR